MFDVVQLSISFACETPKCIQVMAVNIYNAAVAILDTISMALWWVRIDQSE